jgi:hypothetical protein
MHQWGWAMAGNHKAKAYVQRIVRPMGKYLTPGVPGRTGGLAPARRDKEHERELSRTRKSKSDAQKRQKRGALEKDNTLLPQFLASKQGPERAEAKEWLKRNRTPGPK